MSENEYSYKIRAHHGLCLCHFVGKGYSNDFTKNMADIKHKLEKNPLISVVCQTDAICSACPNNADGICKSEDKVEQYDRQVLLRCNISEGQVMPFLDFEKLIRDKILYPRKRREICQDCVWDSLCHSKSLER